MLFTLLSIITVFMFEMLNPSRYYLIKIKSFKEAIDNKASHRGGVGIKILTFKFISFFHSFKFFSFFVRKVRRQN